MTGPRRFIFFNPAGHVTQQFTSPIIYQPLYGGFDSKGDFFADGYDSSLTNPEVVEVARGAGKAVALSSFSLQYSGGVVVDRCRLAPESY